MPCPRLSFEIFPPASVAASFNLCDALSRLQGFAPDYISVTYGAQGSIQGRTLDTVKAVSAQTNVPVAAHLTAARANKADVLARASEFAQAGVKSIVALRGDGDGPGQPFVPHPEGFASSKELISALAEMNKFTLRVGAYPEAHPDSASSHQSIDFLKAKFDAGADEAITQFFFEADTFLRFRDACAKAGITNPIVPGILPIANWDRAKRFAQQCGTSVPDWLDQAFSTAKRDKRADLLGLAVTTELCSTLTEEGCDHLHIYTMNSATLTERLCTALGATQAPVHLRNVA